MLSIDEAIARVLEQCSPLPPVSVPLADAHGLILAEDVCGDVDSPPFDKAMMDGYAVRSSDIPAPPVELLVVEELMAGETARQPLEQGQAIRIMTGAPIPSGADAVVRIEETETLNAGSKVRILTRPEKQENILAVGEMKKAGERILAAGSLLRSQEIAILAEFGHAELTVHPRPRVAILATGDELVPPAVRPGPGQIRNSNEPMLVAQVAELGGVPRGWGIVRDTWEDLSESIMTGLQSEVLLLTGGVSMGAKDLVPLVLEKLGVKKIFHRVQLKPGKPIWFGVWDRKDAPRRLIFGLPGNPVSSMVCSELFVRVALRRLSGHGSVSNDMVSAVISQRIEISSNRPVFWPARLHSGKSGWSVAPLKWKGSADLCTLSRANSLIAFPSGRSVYDIGEQVSVKLLGLPPLSIFSDFHS